MTRQGVTKHLQVLAAAGIIDGSRQGREQVWTLNPQRLADGRRHLEIDRRGMGRRAGAVQNAGRRMTR